MTQNSGNNAPNNKPDENPMNPACRYEEVTSDVYDIMYALIKSYAELNPLANVKIMAVFDLKKKKTKGNLRLAEVKRADDMARFLTTDIFEDRPEGYDVIMIIDKQAWLAAAKVDATDPVRYEYRTRLVRHELRHIFLDVDANKVKLLPHDVEDFQAEVELNVDDPRWSISLAMATEGQYETLSMESETENGSGSGAGAAGQEGGATL